MPEHHGCAARSRDRGEPLLATASTVRRWLLVEQPGPWGHDALLQSAIPDDVAHQLRARARRLGMRPALVRRPGVRANDGPATREAFLVVVDAHTPVVRRLTFTDPATLPEVLDRAVDLGIDGVGDPGPGRLVLVCTHGRHDTCCAVEGRPVAAALAQVLADVWECSHVGGDRFAANVVVLPDGTYHGRVTPSGAETFAEGLATGELALDHYRGSSLHPFAVQAADILLRRQLGVRGRDAVEVLAHRDHDEDAVAVDLAVDGRPWSVVVAVDRDAEGHLLTCRAQRASHAPRYRLVSARPGPSA